MYYIPGWWLLHGRTFCTSLWWPPPRLYRLAAGPHSQTTHVKLELDNLPNWLGECSKFGSSLNIKHARYAWNTHTCESGAHECLTSGSKDKSNSFNIISFWGQWKSRFGSPGAEGKKNKEQVVWLLYEQTMVLCRRDNQSGLVAPSILSKRAAQMVFAPWEVWSRSSQRPRRPRKYSNSSRWGSFDGTLWYFCLLKN